MTNLPVEDSKTRSVNEFVSNLARSPSFKLTTVPPTYITSPSSPASTGRAKVKSRHRAAEILVTVEPPNGIIDKAQRNQSRAMQLRYRPVSALNPLFCS